ncbi:MAG: hypothetical protein NZT61_01860 [Deltaproteobacteria bacterium]|nr:hypothetical protein [Deltaproteobacteria bacterium]
MSLWQYFRHEEKKDLVELAKTNLGKVWQINEITGTEYPNLSEFNLVKGQNLENSAESIFFVRRKFGEELKYKAYGFIKINSSRQHNFYLLAGLGCFGSPDLTLVQNSLKDLKHFWVALRMPQVSPFYVNFVSSIAKVSESNILFIDKSLLEKTFNLELHDLYLERVSEDFSINKLFAFDLTRSELFFGLKSLAGDPFCFKPISPPSLHFSYIFEWLFIGVIGFFLIRFIVKARRV